MDDLKRDLTGEERARSQTNEEWLKEYKTGEKVPPANPSKGYDENTRVVRDPDNTDIPVLIFIEHRTTRFGSVVLEFKDQKTGKLVVDFFNVDITHQRGPKKGQKRETGRGGQFQPPKSHRSKFKTFWLESVGKPPTRWSTVHKSMRSQLSKLEFTGNISEEVDSNGNAYLKLRNTRVLRKKN